MTVIYNPFEPGYIENPYPALKALRDAEPVHRTPQEFWLLTRYHDINEVLRDTTRFSVDHHNERRGIQQDVPYEDIAVILFRDPPAHTRWRKSLSKALTPAHVEAFRPRVAELVEDLLDTLDDKGQVDFVEEVSSLLPFRVISELLGMPAADRPQVRRWTSAIANITEPVASPEVSQAVTRCSDEMREYLRDVCAYKRSHHADDVITRLVADDGPGFTEEELIDHVMLLHVSAHEPTANHLAFGVLSLARNPGQAKTLRDDPSLDRNAVEELLRFEAPLQLTGRFALEDIDIDGHRIECGTPVVMSLAAANHDPARFGPTADELDLRRTRAHDHLSFSRGIHTCFGSTLARLQGQEVFGRMVRRFPKLTLTAEPRWNGMLNHRGPERVPISVR